MLRGEDLNMESEVRQGSVMTLEGQYKWDVPMRPQILSVRSPGLAVSRSKIPVKEAFPDVEGSCSVI